MNNNIGALIIAIVGVIGTLSASIISQVLSARARREELEMQRLQQRDEYEREQDRSLLETQRQITVEFILATDIAHNSLRNVARQSLDLSELKEAARRAVGESNIYAVRERLLIIVPPKVAYPAEEAFHSIIEIRDAVRSGALLDSSQYNDAYDAYYKAIWSLRQAARESFSAVTLNLDVIKEIESAKTRKNA